MQQGFVVFVFFTAHTIDPILRKDSNNIFSVKIFIPIDTCILKMHGLEEEMKIVVRMYCLVYEFINQF